MYNRYIPQPDGSYRRNRMQEPTPPQPRRQAPAPMPPREPQEAPQPKSHEPRPQPLRPQHHPDSSVTGFLKQLLPNDFDTSDLLIVLLILLMAGNCEEDQNNALLTLALYLFM